MNADKKGSYNEKCRERYTNDPVYREKKKKRASKRYYEKVRVVTDFLHGMTKTRSWRAWRNMRSRVMRPTDKNYERYKNYSIDQRWSRFQEFFEDMGVCPEGMTLDRKDNTKGYSKENCRWATPAQQSHNTSKTKLSEKKVAEMRGLFGIVPGYVLAKKYGVSQQTICGVKYGRTWKEVANV